MPPQQTNSNYDFIMQSEQKPAKKLPLPGGNNSMVQRIIIVAGGGILLIILAIVFSAILSSGGDNKDLFVKVAQQQAEITRVADLGLASQNTEQTTKNVTINIKLSVSSDQTQFMRILDENGQKLNPKVVAQGTNPETDTRLETASAAGSYNSMLATVLNEELIDYQSTLQEAYDATQTEAIKTQLGNSINSTASLVKQVQAVISAN